MLFVYVSSDASGESGHLDRLALKPLFESFLLLLIPYIPVNIFSVMSGRIIMG